jgi:serine/threonine-protein kinase
MQCPTCKQVLDPGARFCPHDGTPVTETAAGSGPPPTTPGRPSTKGIQLPAVVGGRYRLVELRGGGGMAKVYRAVDLTLEREVAVKLINPELRAEREFDARFQREARIASQLADPHIVVVHDFGLDAEHGPFLVMEYLQGQSLRERLNNEGPLPLRAGLQLSGQILLALIHAHAKGIVHRDIKPDNIFLLNQSGVRLHLRVLDFGIARIYRREDADRAETLTGTGAVLGTPRYMSPEQLAGQPVDARSDLYSAALVIHEALTGQLPYVSGKTLRQLCPEATPALEGLLDRCLRPNPAERPAGALNVYLQLQELGRASGVLLLPPGALDRLVASRLAEQPTRVEAGRPGPARSLHRRLLLRTGVLLGVLAVLALAKALFFPARVPPSAPGPETLLGVRVGDDFQRAVDHLGLTRGGTMDPWAPGRSLPCLGHLVRVDDLDLSDDERERLEVRWAPDEAVGVVGRDGRVRAVVVRRPHGGATGRGLRVGDGVADLHRLYSETPSEVSFQPLGAAEARPGHDHVEVRRHDALGVGFAVLGDRVAEVALYPPKDEP